MEIAVVVVLALEKAMETTLGLKRPLITSTRTRGRPELRVTTFNGSGFVRCEIFTREV